MQGAAIAPGSWADVAKRPWEGPDGAVGNLGPPSKFQRSFDSNLLFKTVMCRGYLLGNCAFGATCRFAHGEAELKVRPEAAPAAAAPVALSHAVAAAVQQASAPSASYGYAGARPPGQQAAALLSAGTAEAAAPAQSFHLHQQQQWQMQQQLTPQQLAQQQAFAHQQQQLLNKHAMQFVHHAASVQQAHAQAAAAAAAAAAFAPTAHAPPPQAHPAAGTYLSAPLLQLPVPPQPPQAAPAFSPEALAAAGAAAAEQSAQPKPVDLTATQDCRMHVYIPLDTVGTVVGKARGVTFGVCDACAKCNFVASCWRKCYASPRVMMHRNEGHQRRGSTAGLCHRLLTRRGGDFVRSVFATGWGEREGGGRPPRVHDSRAPSERREPAAPGGPSPVHSHSSPLLLLPDALVYGCAFVFGVIRGTTARFVSHHQLHSAADFSAASRWPTLHHIRRWKSGD